MDVKSSEMTKEQENNDWYIFKNCDKHGPLTLQEISSLLIKNQITKDHHVWHAKYNNWMAIKDLSVFEKVGFDLPNSKNRGEFIETAKIGLKGKGEFLDKIEVKQNFWHKIKHFFGK